jgi:hypothetical protein
MQCHAAGGIDAEGIAALRAFAESGERVPWVRVYKVPDYVYFSHGTHVRTAGLDCETCHGTVSARDALWQERPIDMRSCVNCHRSMGASIECNVCHNPG